MPILVSAAKGGSGATVVAASMGCTAACDVVLVDAIGDLGAAIGNVPGDALGVDDWLRSDAPIERLDELVLDTLPGTRLLPWSGCGSVGPETAATRWSDVATWCRRQESAGSVVVIDAGHHAERFRDQTEAGTTDSVRCTEVVVTRACYLSLRPARRSRTPVDAVVLVAEPGRTLSGRDVQRALGAPLVATIPWDPAVARAIDAGVSAASIPRPLRRLGRTLLDACASIGACAQGAA